MKSYASFTAEEIDLIAMALQHHQPDIPKDIRSREMSAKVRKIGNRLCSAIEGKAPCDMELIGADEYEMGH